MVFSIIVPVYNGEKFLYKAVQSVLDQTYTNWELILIDDGSADSSLSIMKEYGAKNAKIKCFTQDNNGVSYTRNRGIGLATGDYILFLDADDELVPNALKTIEESIEKAPADVVVFNSYRVDAKSNVISKATTPFVDHALQLHTEQDKKEYVYSALASDKLFGLACNFATRRALITELHFPENMVLCEDLIFDIQMYEKAKTVVCLPDYLYCYRINSEGCVSKFNPRKLDDLKTAYQAKLGLIERYDMQENRVAALSFFVGSIVGVYSSILENKFISEQFCQQVLQDAYIVERIREYKYLAIPQKVRVDLLFGSPARRSYLRTKVLLRRKLRKWVRSLCSKVKRKFTLKSTI